MGEAALDRIIFGLVTLPFVIFAFVRIFVKENRRNDELFYERAKSEISALRQHCDDLQHRLDGQNRELELMEQRWREERHRSSRLEDEIAELKRQVGLDGAAN